MTYEVYDYDGGLSAVLEDKIIQRINTKQMAKIKVTKVRSAINRTQNQKRVLESLGLHKMGQTVEHEDTLSILGMIRKVNHLVSVEAN